MTSSWAIGFDLESCSALPKLRLPVCCHVCETFYLQWLKTSCLLYYSIPYSVWKVQELHFLEYLCHSKIHMQKCLVFQQILLNSASTRWMNAHQFFKSLFLFFFSFSHHPHQRQNWRNRASCWKGWHHHQWMDGLLSFIWVNVGHCVICPW